MRVIALNRTKTVYSYRHLFAVCALFVLSLGSSLASAQGAGDETLKAAGIRKLESKHLTLYTDLPSVPAVDDLPRVFDLAIPQWAKFFGAKLDEFENWHVRGCVIQNKERFREYGLLPRNLPPFLHGFQMGDRIWVYEQPSDYYRRHLLLHEGTHAATNRVFGHVGPAWYREGIAELLGTHQFVDGKLTMGHFPQDKKLVEHWGRIKIVNDDIEAGKPRSISDIVNLQARDFLNVESYAWSWALQSFGHNHPKFAPHFLSMRTEMTLSKHGVTAEFIRSYQKHREEMDAAWQLFQQHLDYGYDSSLEAIERSSETRALGSEITSFNVDAAKGWQSTGIRLLAGSTVDIVAKGKFQVAKDTEEWISEPSGVTIEYYKKRPLGMLLAAVVDESQQATAFSDPQSVGSRGQVSAKTDGVLYLRINERADRMRDNRGQIAVKVRLRK